MMKLSEKCTVPRRLSEANDGSKVHAPIIKIGSLGMPKTMY